MENNLSNLNQLIVGSVFTITLSALSVSSSSIDEVKVATFPKYDLPIDSIFGKLDLAQNQIETLANARVLESFISNLLENTLNLEQDNINIVNNHFENLLLIV